MSFKVEPKSSQLSQHQDDIKSNEGELNGRDVTVINAKRFDEIKDNYGSSNDEETLDSIMLRPIFAKDFASFIAKEKARGR